MARRLAGVLTVLFVSLAGADVLGLALLWRVPALTRLEPLPPAAFDALGRSAPLPDTADQDAFAAEIEAMATPATPDSLLAWVMDQASAAGAGAPHDVAAPYATLEYARNGGGVLCGDLSLIYHNVLAAAGHRSRIVHLWRTPLHALDTHVTTEVLVDGRWVIYDPTFHVSFERDGRLLGAVDVHQALKRGEHDDIRPVFRGPVRYPARLETWSVDWRTLFANVVFSVDESRGVLARLPPFRYWWGPRVRYLESERPLWPIRAQRQLYRAAVVTLPLVVLALGLTLAVVFVASRGPARDG